MKTDIVNFEEIRKEHMESAPHKGRYRNMLCICDSGVNFKKCCRDKEIAKFVPKELDAPNDTIRDSSKETTRLKIQLALDAIADWNFNRDPGQPRIRVYTGLHSRKLNFKGHYPIKGMNSILTSKKKLVGTLGVLCEILRSKGIRYPWLEA